MKTWILAAATLLLVQGADARERRGPPSACPSPKVDCCEKKPKCAPQKSCEPKQCTPTPCAPAPKPECCPPVCFEKGFPTDSCCIPPAFSQSADIDLKCGWDTFVTANFIYWDVQQDGMILGMPQLGTITAGVLATASINYNCFGAKALVQDTEYTPGFQVGIGWSGPKDNWVMMAQYTWLHGSTHTSANAPNAEAVTLAGIAVPQNGIWDPAPWVSFHQTDRRTQRISSTWKYKIDMLDAQISRPFYSGTRFIWEPFFGLRGVLIRQQLNMTIPTLNNGGTATNGTQIEMHHNSRSAGIGPRAGLNGDWHFGYGMRFIGNFAASLLYTAFDARRNAAAADLQRTPEIMALDDYNALRPNIDMSLGLGWGSYFKCRRFHLDFAATYDFSVFWGQNMMVALADEAWQRGTTNGGDLFLQGLTLKTRFDF